MPPAPAQPLTGTPTMNELAAKAELAELLPHLEKAVALIHELIGKPPARFDAAATKAASRHEKPRLESVLLSKADLAELLNCSKRTVERAASCGNIPGRVKSQGSKCQPFL